MITLLDEMTADNVGDAQLAPHLLRINIRIRVFPCDRRRAYVQRARIGQNAGDFVHQHESQIINAEVAVQILQGDHRDRISIRCCASCAMFEPPCSQSRQHRQQQSCHADHQVLLPWTWSTKSGGDDPQGNVNSRSRLDLARFVLPPYTLQIRFYKSGSLIARRSFLLHRLADDALHFDRQLRIDRPRGRWLLVQHGIERGYYVCAAKRLLACRHLVQNDSERENVAARIEILTSRLFRGHVNGGSWDDADSRKRILEGSIVTCRHTVP